MGWVRIDDAIYDHPKAMAAGLQGVGLMTLLLGWSNRNLTDGHVPGELPARFGADESLLTRLVETGWLEPEGDGYVVHDYHDYQPSAEEIRTKRERERDRWHRRGERSADNGPLHSGDPPGPLRGDSAATPRASQPQPQGEDISRGLAADFDAWWNGYPRKVDKKKAQAKYLARRRAGTTHDALIAARDHYATAVEGRESSFIKHPATFLNGSWEEWVDGSPEANRTALELDR